MHIFVTGAAGFLGSHAVGELLAHGHRVTALDDLRTGHAAALPPAVRFLRGDCGDQDLLRRTFREDRPDGVLHLAASIEAGESMREPGPFFANNTARTLLLLEVLVEAGVPRFAFASSAAVYASAGAVPIREEDAIAPGSPYGHSKRVVEEALEWLHRQRGLGCAVLRCFNAAGCAGDIGEDHAPETHLIPLALDAVLGRSGPLRVLGEDHPTPDGTCVRDYVHASDLAAGFRLALERTGPGEHRVCNLGSGLGASVREVLAMVGEVTGQAVPVVSAPRREGDAAVLVADIARARRELDWEPARSALRPLVESAWAWRRAHPGGYRTPAPV
ncbi:MAG: UDP-glucose 4-epimerase GalE [Holophagaceae bacterium]|nr:UDP-glucose 4-epimerase GalE [Holophagaceae bacterium]